MNLTVTVVGLGQLGLPVAVALDAAGYRIKGYDTKTARLTLAAQHGLLALSNTHIDDGIFSDPWLVTALPDDEAFRVALFGSLDEPSPCGQQKYPESWLERLPRGGVHLCLGTLGVAQAKTAAAAHLARGQHFIATPVFGRPDEAWARDLTALFGPAPGLPETLRQQALGLLTCVAPRIHTVGSPSAACAVKLAGNLMIASAIATMAEAFVMAEAHGAPAALVHEVVTGKLFKGPVYEGVGRAVYRACGDAAPATEAPGFTLQLGLKDLTLYQQAAEAAECQFEVGRTVRQCLAQAVELGYGHRDWAELPACGVRDSACPKSPSPPYAKEPA